MHKGNVRENNWSLIVFFLVLLAACLFIARSSAALDPQETQDVETNTARIIQLADESQLQNQQCRQFLDRIKAVATGSQKKEYFASRASALAVLKLAGQYPGTPLATSEALELFSNLPGYPKGAKLAELTLAMARLGDCYSVEYYGVLTRLMDPRTRKHFTGTQLTHEQWLVLEYIQRESTSGPKFFLQIHELVDLFDRAIREGLISSQPEDRVLVENLKWRISKIRTEGSERFKKLEESASRYPSIGAEGSKRRVESLDSLMWQLSETAEIQDDLSSAVEWELEDLVVPQEMGHLASINLSNTMFGKEK